MCVSCTQSLIDRGVKIRAVSLGNLWVWNEKSHRSFPIYIFSGTPSEISFTMILRFRVNLHNGVDDLRQTSHVLRNNMIDDSVANPLSEFLINTSKSKVWNLCSRIIETSTLPMGFPP